MLEKESLNVKGFIHSKCKSKVKQHEAFFILTTTSRCQNNFRMQLCQCTP